MTRTISPQELGLIRQILVDANSALFVPSFETLIRPLSDGGMGSFSFDLGGTKRYSNTVGDLEFLDSDGKKVLASLYLDDEGGLLELDIFKSDYSPVEAIPSVFD